MSLPRIRRMLTPGRIARYCQVDPRTVNRWIRQGILKSHPLPITKFNRIRVSDFLLFLREQNMPVPEELRAADLKRILIVDDESSMVKAIQRILSLVAPDKFLIETAGDGFAAGQVLEKFKPDLLILDLLMPLMDGFEVCRQIKQNPETRHIKILAISGLTGTKDNQRAFDLGADDFLAKPFENDELVRRVSTLLDEGGESE